MTRRLALGWLVAVLGCTGPDHDHGHPHPHPPAGEAAHPHGAHGEHDDHGGEAHGHGAAESVTRYGARTQLYAEFPALVVGEPSPFAAHLTRLDSHAPVAKGRVLVELSGGGKPTEYFAVEGPRTPGIFRPVARPAHPGERTLTLRWARGDEAEAHRLGAFTVFPSRAAADAAHQAAAPEPGAIAFLLEQQWQVPFGVAQVVQRPLRPSVPAFAKLTLAPTGEAVVTAPRAGRVQAVGEAVPVVGAAVARGEPLCRLGTAPPGEADQATLAHAVERAGIRVAAAQRDVDRLTPLVAQGVVAQRRLDDALSALAVARAERRTARRRVKSLARAGQVAAGPDQLTVPAPIGGRVADWWISAGTWVTAGTRLGRVVDPSRLWVELAVPQAYAGRLEAVTGAWFTAPGGQAVEVGRGALVSVAAEVDEATRTLPVRFELKAPGHGLLPGMTAPAQVAVGAPRDALAVPEAAVVDDNGVAVVYVQTSGEAFSRRPVTLGVRDRGLVQITRGVRAGEWVVARGAYTVKLAATDTGALGHGHAH